MTTKQEIKQAAIALIAIHGSNPSWEAVVHQAMDMLEFDGDYDEDIALDNLATDIDEMIGKLA